MGILTFFKKNWRLFAYVYAILITIIALFCFKSCLNEKKETERLLNNEKTLVSNLETFKTKNGKDAVRITELEMTTEEFKAVCSEQAEIINDLNIKLKRLETISTSGIETDLLVKTVLKDSIVYNIVDTVNNIILYDTVHVKTFGWNDEWNSINGTIKNDSVICTYFGTDTISVVAERVPKKFLFFKWGTKRIDINIVNANPNTKITYNKTIKIAKKK